MTEKRFRSISSMLPIFTLFCTLAEIVVSMRVAALIELAIFAGNTTSNDVEKQTSAQKHFANFYDNRAKTNLSPTNSSAEKAIVSSHLRRFHTVLRRSRTMHDGIMEDTFHIFGPCTFPPRDFETNFFTEPNRQSPQATVESQFRRVCRTSAQLPFICDLHETLSQRDLNRINEQFMKSKPHFCNLDEQNSENPFGIFIARQLAQPASMEEVTRSNPEFECLFRLPCLPMDENTIYKFVHNVRTFAKLYAAAIFMRWFPHVFQFKFDRLEYCGNPRVIVLILLDGLLANPKKLTTVYLYTDNNYFQPFITNIQIETANLILQGVPLADVISDLILQLQFAYDDYNVTGGQPRRHGVPTWAWQLMAVSASLAICAVLIEWLIVRKRFTRKRYVPGPVVDSLKSKAHMIF